MNDFMRTNVWPVIQLVLGVVLIGFCLWVIFVWQDTYVSGRSVPVTSASTEQQLLPNPPR